MQGWQEQRKASDAKLTRAAFKLGGLRRRGGARCAGWLTDVAVSAAGCGRLVETVNGASRSHQGKFERFDHGVVDVCLSCVR